MKKAAYTLIVLLAVGIGFYFGRSTVEITEEIKYVKGDTQTQYVRIYAPASERITKDLKIPDIEIPKDFYIPDSVDLKPTVYDWNLERQYNQVLFDNQYGKLTLNGTVQYNQLQSAQYSFIPIEKHVYQYREKVWQPFVMGSYSTMNTVGAGCGLYYHDIGLGVRYVTDFKNKGFDFSLFYKF